MKKIHWKLYIKVSDLNINQLLEDNTDEIIAELAEEYKAKQSKKKAKER